MKQGRRQKGTVGPWGALVVYGVVRKRQEPGRVCARVKHNHLSPALPSHAHFFPWHYCISRFPSASTQYPLHGAGSASC